MRDHDLAQAALLDARDIPEVEGAFAKFRDGARLVGLTAALWTLYVPHYVVLRLLGPRWGMHWVAFAANLHWLFTFVGAQASTRRALKSMHPYFHTRLSVSQILRRHLRLKHECFARVRVFNFHGAAESPSDLHWRVNPESASALPAEPRQGGLVLVGFHFNFFLLSPAAIKHILPGVDLVQLRYRTWQSVEEAASRVARLALRKAMDADRRAGATVFYIDENTILELFRLLRHGGVVAVTADGGAAGDFLEVPFFDGLLRVPGGWAKLAAATKSDVLLVCDQEIDRTTRDGVFFNHIRCSGTGDQAAYAACAESIRILEQMIREEPWGWHPWQRLRVEIGADGVRRYSLKQYGFKEGEKLSGKPRASASRIAADSATPAAEANGSMPATTRHARPRVAVLANSYPPYRVHLHQHILAQIPEIELWSLATHSNAYSRWKGLQAPATIRPVEFGRGEPTDEQTQLRYSLREWFKAGRIIRWLRDREVDAVFCQGCGDLGRMRIIRWCHKSGIPCYLTGDFNIRTDNHPPLKRWIKRQVYERAVDWCTGLMPCGENGLALLHRYGGQRKPSFMFPFVPDFALFANTPGAAIDKARERFGLREGRPRLVFSARMMSAKRPDLAIRAFEEIAAERPDWDLLMVGDGPLRAELQAGVSPALRDRVIWTGFLNDAAEIAALYAVSDALVLPSDHEPWGVVVVEAAAAGLALIASHVVGAAPELVQPGRNGALFTAGDRASLTKAMREITAPAAIDGAKQASRAVLDEWLLGDEPVANLRAALVHCGLLRPAAASSEKPYWMGTVGAAVAPV